MIGFRRILALLVGGCVVLSVSSARADGKREMSDLELDAVTAGAASDDDADRLLTFELERTTRSGNTITVAGDVSKLEAIDSIELGALTLTDNAQSNLQSLININAVNSAVNVLLNLNVTIDSSVGSVNQFNLNGTLPTAVPNLPK